jgi:threonine dehydratase
VRDTPIRRSRRLSRSNGADVLLKLETLQITGSLKPRGAIHKLLSLDDAERRAPPASRSCPVRN